ncbi:peptidylprolyl isomerase [Elioraea rosea]|uniref:peptidylprolyl isomerase n=1 Tax=Elioraea rosea TaxID=2492390 RepID=UPI00118359D9|nr:peptidylprolyl isomerase [Elioraea rosea]
MPVRVNDTVIPEREIAAEMQHHPAPTRDLAWQEAARALVVRRLLLDAAAERGIAPPEDGTLVAEEAMIEALLDDVVSVPEADEESLRRWYDANRARFRSKELWDASHILIAADPADETERRTAEARARDLLDRVLADRSVFSALAEAHSACPSGKQGGRLGQVTRGSLVPEVETFLSALESGQICPTVVKSRYGMHVLWLHERAEPRQLPFEAVREDVARFLRETSWRRAVHQFIALLAGRARIEGVELDGAAATPLVQ